MAKLQRSRRDLERLLGLYLTISTMEDMEAGSGFWMFDFCEGRRHAHCVCPSQREVVSDCLCFGKRIYHANPALDSDDGFDLLAKKSLIVLRKSVGRF